MDIREVARLWAARRKIEEHSSRSQTIEVPLTFPFLTIAAKSQIIDSKDGTRRVQQRVDWSEGGANPRSIDPGQMRNDCMALKHNERELLRFLNRYGLWESEQGFDVSDFWDFQEFLQLLLRLGPRARGQLLSRSAFGKLPGPFYKSMTIDFEYNRGGLQFVVRTFSCLDTIIASVQIELAHGTKYQKCFRKDCPVVFPLTTRHKRKYHSEWCRHLEVVRRSRRKG